MTWRLVTTILISTSMLIGQSAADFQLDVTVPDDPDFPYQFASAEFPEMTEILSVTSPVPHLIMGDESGGAKNRISYRGSLPDCQVPVSIVGKKPDGTIVRYTGSVNLSPTKTSDLPHAVVVKGDDPKLDVLIKDLKGGYTVVVASNKPSTPAGTSEVAILLKDKTGKIIPKEDAERIIKEKLKDAKNNGLAIEKPDCYAICKETCDTVLEFDKSAAPVQAASVPTNSGNVYAGLSTKWEFKCGKDAFKDISGVCGPTTCANGGTCSTSQSGTSNSICTCKQQNNEVFGPKCQLLTRSYLSNGPSSSVFTFHDVQQIGMNSQTLTLSFEHAGDCTLGAGSLCTILTVGSNSKLLLNVQQGRVNEPRYTSATLPRTPVDAHKMIVYSDRHVQNKRWMDTTVVAEITGGQVKSVTTFCSKDEIPICLERKATASFSDHFSLKDAVVSIGGTFKGCFRNVRLNGRIVDLTPSSVTGDASLTQENCDAQTASCGGSTGGGHTCGPKSVCYGQLGSRFPEMACRCACTNSMRMDLERITLSARCASVCSKDAPIINTGASGHQLSWSMQDASPIHLRAGAPFTIRLNMRTLQENSPEMIRVDGMSTQGNLDIIVKIQGEVLICCVKSVCYAFVPKSVSDGNWHEVFVKIAESQITTRLDDFARVHSMAQSIEVTGATVKMQLASSCISGVRISDIYMPTSDGDKTEDSGSAFVKLQAGSGATSKSTCDDPVPSCGCNAATEDCDNKWGKKSCNCKPGHKRYSGGSCAAPSGNPCSRLSITCPNPGGKCVQSGAKWLVCQ